jgi:RHS repeat-associated protein
VPQVRRLNLGLGVASSFSLFHVDRHESQRASVVKPPTTRRPISRVFHQSSNHRIRVHIIQLFRLLSLAVHIEIVKPRLPERPQWRSRLPKRQSHLSHTRRPSVLPQFPRHTQLQLLQHRRGRALLRLAHQEMHMFRHHHISEKMKSHLIAHLSQFFHEDVPRARRLQQRQPPIATERNKMQMTFAVVAPQSGRHRKTPRKESQPQDPGSKNEPGAPFASLYFPEKNPTDILFETPLFANINFPESGPPAYDADFYPYGGERAYTNRCPSANVYKFEGKERDTETGNDDFGARYYSNRFGRWLSADWSAVPVAVPYANLTNPQTLNLYSMVSDDPESFADLDGHCWPASACADVLDSYIHVFRQDGMAANDHTSPAVAAINTFANGVTADLASGAADILRLGNGTAAAIDSAKQGDYLGAASNLSQDGGRVAGIILIVAGGEAKAQGDANALGRQVEAQGAKGGNQSVPGSYPESTVNRAGQQFVDKNGPSQPLTGRQGSTTTGTKSTNPQTGQTNVFRNAQPKANTPGRTANFETKPQPKGPNTSNVHVKINE